MTLIASKLLNSFIGYLNGVFSSRDTKSNMQVILISFIFVNYVNGTRFYGNLGDQIGDGKEWFRSDLQYINRVWQLDNDLQEKFNPFQPADNVWLKNIKQKPRADTTKPTIIKHWNKMIFNWE